MSDIEQMSYTEIMPRVGELADELLNHPDEEVRVQIEELLDWVDVFHREGLHRIVDLILAWRGDIFLEQVEKDEIVGPFLSVYDIGEDTGEDTGDDTGEGPGDAAPAAEAPASGPTGATGTTDADALFSGDFS